MCVVKAVTFKKYSGMLLFPPFKLRSLSFLVLRLRCHSNPRARALKKRLCTGLTLGHTPLGTHTHTHTHQVQIGQRLFLLTVEFITWSSGLSSPCSCFPPIFLPPPACRRRHVCACACARVPEGASGSGAALPAANWVNWVTLITFQPRISRRLAAAALAEGTGGLLVARQPRSNPHKSPPLLPPSRWCV